MTPTRSDVPLGEVAYLDYWRGLAPLTLPWPRLSQEERRAWQRAAWAVLRARDARTGTAMPDAAGTGAPSSVPLRDQLACARRELARRERVYPRLVANETMRPQAAEQELKAMEAIVRTLARLVAGEERLG